jgi:hypothetical protein
MKTTLEALEILTTAANDIGIMTVFAPEDFTLYDLENA